MYIHECRFLTYIGDLCVSRGVAIQRVQAMVCDVVLKDQNADVLMSIRWGWREEGGGGERLGGGGKRKENEGRGREGREGREGRWMDNMQSTCTCTWNVHIHVHVHVCVCTCTYTCNFTLLMHVNEIHIWMDIHVHVAWCESCYLHMWLQYAGEQHHSALDRGGNSALQVPAGASHGSSGWECGRSEEPGVLHCPAAALL